MTEIWILCQHKLVCDQTDHPVYSKLHLIIFCKTQIPIWNAFRAPEEKRKYEAQVKGVQILLSRIQAVPARTV